MTDVEALIAEIEALHIREEPGVYSRVATCEHCRMLCHSYSGLNCDTNDGAFPCETMKIVEKYRNKS